MDARVATACQMLVRSQALSATPSRVRASGLRGVRDEAAGVTSSTRTTRSRPEPSALRPAARRVEADRRAGEVVPAGAARGSSRPRTTASGRDRARRDAAGAAAEPVLAAPWPRARASPARTQPTPAERRRLAVAACRSRRSSRPRRPSRHDERGVEVLVRPDAEPGLLARAAGSNSISVREPSSRSAAGAGRRGRARRRRQGRGARPRAAGTRVARGATRHAATGLRTKTQLAGERRARRPVASARGPLGRSAGAPAPPSRARAGASAASRRRPSAPARGTSPGRGGGAGLRSAGSPRSTAHVLPSSSSTRSAWPVAWIGWRGRSRWVSSGPCGDGSNGPYGPGAPRDDDRVAVARPALGRDEVVPAAATVEVRRLRPDAAGALARSRAARARSARPPSASASSAW